MGYEAIWVERGKSDGLQRRSRGCLREHRCRGRSGGLLDILAHPNQAKYPKQRVLVVAYDSYTYLVPFVEEEEYFFLKTIIPSRKATRDYLNLGEEDAEH